MKLKTTILLAFFLLTSYSAQASIYITYPEDVNVYKKIAYAIQKNLNKKTLSTLQLNHSEIEVMSFSEIKGHSLKKDSLVINIGKKSPNPNYLTQSNTPTLYTFTTRKNASTINSYAKDNPWAAIVIDQPLQRLVNIAEKTMRNDYKKIIIVIASEKNDYAIQEINNLEEKSKTNIKILRIKEGDTAAKTIKKDLSNAAAIIAIHDQNVWSGNNARWILHQAYSHKIPVIGYSKAFLKAGAMISIYSSAEQIIEETERRVIEWIEKGHFEKQINSPKYQIEVNRNIAKALQYRPSSIAKIVRENNDI